MKIHVTETARIVRDVKFGRIDWCCAAASSWYTKRLLTVESNAVFIGDYQHGWRLPIVYCPWCGEKVDVETTIK